METAQRTLVEQITIPGVELREATREDIPALVAFGNALWPRAFWSTEERSSFYWLPLDPDCKQTRIVGFKDGEMVIAAFTEATRKGTDTDPGEVMIMIRPDLRRQGIGSLLLPPLEEQSARWGAKVIWSYANSMMSGGKEFLETFGYQDSCTATFSEVVLVDGNFEPFRQKTDALCADGYAFFRLSEADTPQNRRKAHELAIWIDKEMPTDGEIPPPMSFEAWEKWIFGGGPSCSPRQVFIAGHGEDWVAMTALIYPLKDMAVTATTGVRTDHRSKGLAGAVKYYSLTQAAEDGILTAVTENSKKNAPMLSVNVKLGYKPIFDTYLMEKRIAE